MQNPTGPTRAHVLSTSSSMLGVCIMILSLSRIDQRDTSFWLIDASVTLGALAFLISTFLSFHSIRLGERNEREARIAECMAETVFLVGISVLGVAAILLALVVL